MQRMSITGAFSIFKVNFLLAVRTNLLLAAAYLLSISLFRGIAKFGYGSFSGVSGTVRNTRGNIPYCSARCLTEIVETDTRSSLYKEDFSLENSIAAFRYVNAVADYDGKPIFWHYGMEKLYLPVCSLCSRNSY